MTQFEYHCTERPSLERMEKKIDKLTDLIAQVAVTQVSVGHLEQTVEKHDKRLQIIEAQPRRFLWLVLGAAATIATAVMLKGMAF